MRNIGIIAEYNPFHNGHKYQIDYAKSALGFDNVVVAMSGSFTQRGEIAITDKYSRAEMALFGGADLVLEIPTIFATASAREYATAGVNLLYSTGIVSDILFGTENADENTILEISQAIVSAESSGSFDEMIRLELSTGSTYAVARAKAICNIIGSADDIEALISTPNNILAIEYTCCILRNGYDITIHCLNRCDNGYHSNVPHDEFASASFIRGKALEQNTNSLTYNKTDSFSSTALDSIASYVPASALDIIHSATLLSPDDISVLLHEKLILEDDFTSYLDCTESISNKILNSRNDFVSFTGFIETLKTKELSYTRISRVLIHILLGIKKELFDDTKARNYISYIRVLGCSESGVKLLGTLGTPTSPLIISPQDVSIENLSPNAQDCFSIDEYAYNIYRIITTSKTGIATPVEKSRKFLKVQR